MADQQQELKLLRYTIYAEKDGYQSTNVDMIFKEGHTVHWIYMDPSPNGGTGEKRYRCKKKPLPSTKISELG